MCKLLSEVGTLLFTSENQASDFFKELSDASVWKRVYTKELSAVGIAPNPIFIKDIRKATEIHSSVSDESIEENMASLTLGLKVPMDTHTETYPLGETAFSTLTDRAGYGKNSPALMTLKKKNSRAPMDEEQRATVLNYGLKNSEDKAWVLIRDEKVRATLSGDDNDYSPIDFTKLMKIFREELTKTFKEVEFDSATADHFYSTALYRIYDKELKQDIVNAFSVGCIDASAFTPCVRIITSDVGICGVNLYPYLKSQNSSIMLGKPLSLPHRYQNGLSDFQENVRKCYSLFKDVDEKLLEMANSSIRNPAGCLQKAAKICGLSKKTAIEKSISFERMYGRAATQMDIYWALQEIFDSMNPDRLTESRKIFLQENISRVCFSDFTDLDVPFNWE